MKPFLWTAAAVGTLWGLRWVLMKDDARINARLISTLYPDGTNPGTNSDDVPQR